ncbi:glycine betaine/L-proline ABC transporter permease ProW [Paenalcaligenes niemegkensis]|uniref:glycine betaine/L-proline ABC transporter permease ProW n=1 Tax=Paenalcaligenes niemegkensis TaxID=2895469 RepID=UPI001EE8B1FD|nr:glycine betaine/L-proline ABC transporter permease ProW [Paenalcaligenes niemegkensis]MCQ9617671.1 glycine betaine/L-proline ABC transporter permease ProW [Paenalcaligenes niemegkensis]
MENQNTPEKDNDLAQQWGSMSSGFEESSNGFLNAVEHVEVENAFNWLRPFDEALIPLGDYVVAMLSWVVTHFRPTFQLVRAPVDYILKGIEMGLLWVPQPVMLLFVVLLGWRLGKTKMAIGSLLALVSIGAIGAWDEAMVTLSLVLTSLFFCIVIGLPLGILTAKSDHVERISRPILDAMQTTPAFVYLVPIVMLFGIGNVPGVVVTIVFALPPLVRLTNLGIRQVNPDLIEASHSFGAAPMQMLFKVQLPLASPTIMAGVNQSLMLALSMVVIGSMIAVGGLGQMVLRGIGRLDMGLAAVGGVGIVLLAVVLDRMTQALIKKK